MVTRRTEVPHWLGLVRLGVASALVCAALACNALLDNEPRVLAPSGGQGGEGGTEEPRNGGNAGEGAAGAGASGESSTGKGGTGASATSDGGAAGDAGSRSEGGESGSAPDACELPTAECSYGEMEDADSVPCGHCGSQPAIRLCTETCVWGEPDPNGDCTGEGCSPGDTEAQTVNCACGGTKQQIKTCSDMCGWGAWMDTTACDLTCCTTVVYCNTQESMVASEFPGRGTWCRQTACSQAEADADCLASADRACGGIAPNLFMEYL
jgi:hypothetical protein